MSVLQDFLERAFPGLALYVVPLLPVQSDPDPGLDV